MSRLAAVGFVLALLFVAAVGPVGVGTAEQATSSSAEDQFAVQQEFDKTRYYITVYENGSARWTFQQRKQGLNETEEEQFRQFAEEFNDNETELYSDFMRRAGALTQQGSNATGRSMSAVRFSKSARVDETIGTQGVVEMSFTWKNFAVTAGNEVVVGDVFEGGLYIGPEQLLVIEHGPNLAFEDHEPEANSTSPERITWRGERSFPPERPRVVLVPEEQVAGSPGQPTDSPDVPDEGGMDFLPVLALALALILGGGVALAYRSGALDGAVPVVSDDGDEGDSTAATTGAATGAEPAITDEDLLSDEDRVLELLGDRGGRMKQVNIVEETGWSKSKVSMLLSDMEEAGDISKLRVGRENIVSLAGEEPEAAGSPFDEDEQADE